MSIWILKPNSSCVPFYHQKSWATLIFSSHHLHHVAGLAQRVLAMQNGRIVRDVAPSPELLEMLKIDLAPEAGDNG